MKRLFFLFFSLIVASVCSAQTQHGYVKTRGRLDAAGKLIPGKRLSGAAISIKGRNTVQSGNNGTFSFKILNNIYYLTNVRKDGYQLCDHDFISKGYHVSKDPLIVVMETPDNVLADRLAAANNIHRVLRKQIRAREDKIETLIEQQKITEEQYRQQLQKLRDERDKSERIVSEMAEWYSNIDYDQLDEVNLRIRSFILNGELMKADSVINSNGDIHSRVAALKLLQDANTKLEKYTQKKLEELAQDCYNKHDIFKISLQHDSAAYYIEFRAGLDSTNAQWQLEAGVFLDRYLAAYDQALVYFNRALQTTLQRYGEKHYSTAKIYNNIGCVYSSKGDYSKALEYYAKTLEIEKSIFGEKHSTIGTSYGNMGVVFFRKGDYRQALEYHTTALKVQEDILVKDSTSLAKNYNNIASVYSAQGDYPQALKNFMKALEIHKDLFGENHPAVAKIYSNLGAVYNDIGDTSKALECQTKALSIRKKIFEEHHPDIASSYNNIGTIYIFQKDYSKALEYLIKAQEIREEIYGKNHPAVATSYNNIGGIYQRNGDHQKALEYFCQALEIRKAIFGENHPAVAMSYNNVGGEYDFQGNDSVALEYYNKALKIRETILGENHPDVAVSYNNIGTLYGKQGDYPKALEYFTKALDILSIHFDETHPKVLVAKKHVELIKAMMSK